MEIKVFTEKKEVRCLSDEEVKYMFSRLRTAKYRFMASIMLDCGLRVSECISLRISDFNFHGEYLLVDSKKKRKSQPKEKMPITKRVLEYAAEYWTELNESEKQPTEYMFPCQNYKDSKKPLSRKQVWRVFNNACGFDPHWLRHTYVTRLVENGADFHVTMELARHNSVDTTRKYVHASYERRREAVNSLQRYNTIQSIWYKLFPSRALEVLPYSFSVSTQHVGRKQEIARLTELSIKKINTILIGEQGVGKSHILNKLDIPNSLRIDDTDQMKKTLVNTVTYLAETKEKLAELLELNVKVITKYSIKRLVEMLQKLTDVQEYTLIFDDVTKITPTALRILEKLRHHFHIIAAARFVELKNASWLTNFEKIELKPFNQLETMEMIDRNCKDFRDRIEDYMAFRTHLWNITSGVPLLIVESLDRYRKERVIRADSFREFSASTSRGEISAVPFLFLLVGSLVVLKYWSREAMHDDKEAFMIFGASAMVFLMFGRFLFVNFKRKHI